MDQMASACGEANKLLAMVCQVGYLHAIVTWFALKYILEIFWLSFIISLGTNLKYINVGMVNPAYICPPCDVIFYLDM